MMNKMTVVLTYHVAKESFPLRCGFEGVKGDLIELFDYVKTDRGKGGATSYLAHISIPNTEEIMKMTFIVKNGMLKTAYCGEAKDELALSGLTKHYSVETLLDLHPIYKKGLAATFDTIISAAEEINKAKGHTEGRTEAIEEFQPIYNDLVDTVDDQEVKLKDKDVLLAEHVDTISDHVDTISEQGDTISDHVDTISNQDATISNQDATISEQVDTIFDLEKIRDAIVQVESTVKKAYGRWVKSAWLPPVGLRKVFISDNGVNNWGKPTRALVLLLTDGTSRKTKWDATTFESRVDVYKDLEGKLIQTNVANTADGFQYSGDEWFNEVRLAE